MRVFITEAMREKRKKIRPYINLDGTLKENTPEEIKKLREELKKELSN